MVFIGRQFYKYQTKSEASVTDVYRTGRMMNTSIDRSKGMLIPCQYSDKDNQPLFSTAAATGVTIGLLINPFNNQCGAVQQPFQGLVENTEANCSILLEAFSGETRGSSGSLAKKRESISKDERSNNGENGDENIDSSDNPGEPLLSVAVSVPATDAPETTTNVPVAAEPVPIGPFPSSTPPLKQKPERPSPPGFSKSLSAATGSAPATPARTRKPSNLFARFAFGRRLGFLGKSASVSKLSVSTDAPSQSISTVEQQGSGALEKKKASKVSFRMPRIVRGSSQLSVGVPESHRAGSGAVKQEVSGSMERNKGKRRSLKFPWFFRRRPSVMTGTEPEVTGTEPEVTGAAPEVTGTAPASCEARVGSSVAKEAVAEGESTAGEPHTLDSGTRSRRGSATGPQEQE